MLAATLGGFLGLSLVIGLGFWLVAPGDPDSTGFRAYLSRSEHPVAAEARPTDPLAPPSSASTYVTSGVQAVAGMPFAIYGSELLSAMDAVGEDLETATAYRTVEATTSIRDGSPLSFVSVAIVTPTGLRRAITVALDASPFAYSPPLVELPARVEPGVRWSGRGRVTGNGAYAFRGLMEPRRAGDASCIAARGTRVIRRPPQPVSTRRTRDTWCIDRGRVGTRLLDTGGRVVEVPADRVSWPEPVLAPLQVPPMGTRLTVPFAGGGLPVSLPPVATRAGIVAASARNGDVLAMSGNAPARTAGLVSMVWLQHPGGQVLGLASGGDRVFATTSQRRLVAMDMAGRVRWSSLLPDGATGSPAVSGGTVAVALLDGSVHGFDIRSGRETWAVALSDTIRAPVVAGAGRFIAADVSGAVVSLDEDGAVAWEASVDRVEDTITAFPDGSVLVPQSTGTIALIGRDGEEAWSAFSSAAVTGTAVRWRDVLAVPTDAGLLGMRAASGEVAWEKPELPSAQPTPGGLVVAGADVVGVNPDGSSVPVTTVRSAEGAPVPRAYLVAYRDGWAAVADDGAVTFLGGTGG